MQSAQPLVSTFESLYRDLTDMGKQPTVRELLESVAEIEHERETERSRFNEVIEKHYKKMFNLQYLLDDCHRHREDFEESSAKYDALVQVTGDTIGPDELREPSYQRGVRKVIS